MLLPPNIQQAIAQAIAQASPDTASLANQAAQAAEASISAGLTAILNARTSQLQTELADAIAQLRADLVPPAINTDAIASQAARTVEAQIGSGIQAIVEQAAASFRTDLAASLELFKEEVNKSKSSSEAALQAVAELENEMRDWTNHDRYELTRAQITKIMRDLNV